MNVLAFQNAAGSPPSTAALATGLVAKAIFVNERFVKL